jgi:hypothetical protein
LTHASAAIKSKARLALLDYARAQTVLSIEVRRRRTVVTVTLCKRTRPTWLPRQANVIAIAPAFRHIAFEEKSIII